MKDFKKLIREAHLGNPLNENDEETDREKNDEETEHEKNDERDYSEDTEESDILIENGIKWKRGDDGCLWLYDDHVSDDDTEKDVSQFYDAETDNLDLQGLIDSGFISLNELSSIYGHGSHYMADDVTSCSSQEE